MKKYIRNNKILLLGLGISTLIAICIFFSCTIRIPGYQKQYIEKSEWRQIDGPDLINYSKGLNQIGSGVYEVISEKAEINLKDESINGFSFLCFDIFELNNSGISAFITSGGKTEKVWITKGYNELLLTYPVTDGSLVISLMNAQNTVFRLNSILVQKNVKGFRFSGTLLFLTVLLVLSVTIAVHKQMVIGTFSKALILFIEFIMFFLQMRNVFYYFDDYGYLALTYHGLYHPAGGDYGLRDVCSFLGNHYLYWGGRILYFFFEIVLGKNIMAIRLVQTLLMCLFVVVCVKLSNQGWKKNPGIISYILPAMALFLVEIVILRESAYWFTASVLYFFPVPFMLIGTYLFYQGWNDYQKEENRNNKKIHICCIVSLFLGAFSQEQISASTLGMVMFVTALMIIKKKRISVFHILEIIAASLGFFILLVCPGSRNRLEDSVRNSLTENVHSIMNVITSEGVKWLTALIVTISIMVCLMACWRAKRRYARIALCFMIAIDVILGTGMIVKNCGLYTVVECFFRKLKIEKSNTLIFPLLLVYLAFIVIQMAVWFIHYDRLFYYVSLLAGSLIALMVAVSSPSIASRMILPFYLMLIPCICRVFLVFLSLLKEWKVLYGSFVLSVFLTLSLLNYSYILKGYFANAEYEEYNAEVLKNVNEYVNYYGGVELYKHSDDLFGYMMPYMDNYDWISENIKEYYEIPNDVTFTWKGENDIIIE